MNSLTYLHENPREHHVIRRNLSVAVLNFLQSLIKNKTKGAKFSYESDASDIS